MSIWKFTETARVECSFGAWCALVTLQKDGIAESFYLNFAAAEPTIGQADAAGKALALRKNVEEAPLVDSGTLSREDFFSRFTNTEIAAIYRAAPLNDTLFAYVKKMEINPTIQRTNSDTLGGLALLEQAGLIGPGRAAEILR